MENILTKTSDFELRPISVELSLVKNINTYKRLLLIFI